jgi:hypothetical protein
MAIPSDGSASSPSWASVKCKESSAHRRHCISAAATSWLAQPQSALPERISAFDRHQLLPLKRGSPDTLSARLLRGALCNRKCRSSLETRDLCRELGLVAPTEPRHRSMPCSGQNRSAAKAGQ